MRELALTDAKSRQCSCTLTGPISTLLVLELPGPFQGPAFTASTSVCRAAPTPLGPEFSLVGRMAQPPRIMPELFPSAPTPWSQPSPLARPLLLWAHPARMLGLNCPGLIC